MTKASRDPGYSADRILLTPYQNVSLSEYRKEKRRLQIELLRIQSQIIEGNKRVCIVFEGRDAAGKGSTIFRIMEHLMPQNLRVVRLGIPTSKESKYWFNRYHKELPEPGELVLFDRSWYNRALIEPTMGYCTHSQYLYFMKNVMEWEHKLINEGIVLLKFYLSVAMDTQLIRFNERKSDPLTHWKYSENDLQARKKWTTFTDYKDRMFRYTSSPKSPWAIVNGNSKQTARLTCMLHMVRKLGDRQLKPLVHEDSNANNRYSLTINQVAFDDINHAQYEIIKKLIDNQSDIQPPLNLQVQQLTNGQAKRKIG